MRLLQIISGGFGLLCVGVVVFACSGGGTGDFGTIDPLPDASASSSSGGTGPGCGNGIKDPAESDVDCGGGCSIKCTPGKHCAANRDCDTNFCSGAVCANVPPPPQPSCTDAIRNGTEVDVDCGGTACPKCIDGKHCVSNPDCAGGICTGGRCRSPGCNDSIKNNGESDIDCGGPCTQCTIGRTCSANTDCVTNTCNVTCIAKPTLSSITPSFAATAGGTKITFNGTNFVNAPGFSAMIGTSSVTATYLSTSQVYAFAPAAAASTVDVSILGMPGGTMTLPLALVYTDSPPIDLLFGTAQTFGYTPALAIGVGDMNGDGKIDWIQDHSNSHFDAFTNSTAAAATTASFSGAGTGIPPSGARRTLLVDVNGDLKADLITAESTNMLGISLRDATGSAFGTKVDMPTNNTSPEGVVVADFNGDVKPDIAVVHSGADFITVFLNKGDGTGTFNPGVPYAAPRGTRIVAADFDADGYSDLATSDSVNSQVNVLINNKSGGFGASAPLALTSPSAGIAVGDVNFDGKIDIVAANGSKVSTLRGVGNGTFLAALDTTIAGATGATSMPVIQLADLNNDNKADLVLLNATTGQVEIWISIGGAFASASKTFANPAPQDLFLADFNNDGKLDLIYSGSQGMRVVLRQ